MITLNNRQFCENCFADIVREPCPECGFSKEKYTVPVGALPVGSILMGKYIVGGVIGQGGFGVTYRAFDVKENRVVAVKEYFPNSLAARDDDHITVVMTDSANYDVFRNGIEKFYNEASLLSRFNGNRNIVSVYEFFYENNTAYFVMEFLKGISLKTYIARYGVLSPAKTLYMMSEVSNALLAAHSVNVLHRDISPDNIMICENGYMKLIDFGAARQVFADNPKSMSVILKQGFAPIEQYQKRGKQGTWTDIYSLGATAYYSLTKDCLDDPMTRMDNDDDFSSNRYGLDRRMWELIAHATEIRIQDRYQDAFDLRNAISRVGITPEPIALPIVKKPPVRGVTPAADKQPDVPENNMPIVPYGQPAKKPVNKPLIAALISAGVLLAGAGATIALILGNFYKGIPVIEVRTDTSSSKSANTMNGSGNAAISVTARVFTALPDNVADPEKHTAECKNKAQFRISRDCAFYIIMPVYRAFFPVPRYCSFCRSNLQAPFGMI